MINIQPDERMQSLEAYNAKSVKRGSGKVWFLNGELHRVYHRNRAQGIITLYNMNQDKLVTVQVEEWVKKRQKAYNMRETGALVNRHPKYIPYLVRRGFIPPPIGAQPGGARAFRVRCYYSSDMVFEVRDILANRSWGYPRKDGLVTNNKTPTVQEVRRRMGSEMLQYTKDKDGKIVPIWSETV